jgi:predicted transcriptional regulator
LLQNLDCQTIAYNFHTLGLNVIPIQEDSKRPALQTFAWWQYDQQEANDIERVVYDPHLNLAVLGGVASGNAFFLDCETPECFSDFSKIVSAQHGELATVTSQRGGHLWLRAPFPVKSHSYGDFEIKGQGNYVLAPPSTHPSGTQYQFTSNTRRIPLVSGLPFVALEPKFVPNISRFAHDLFRGRLSHEYRSRSECDQSFILSLVRSGFEREQIGKFISIAQYPSKYRELLNESEKSAAQYLEHSIKKALAQPESEAFLEARTIAAQWEQWALAERWIGRTGAVDRAVFLAHIYCAHSTGLLTYNASVRQLAEIAQASIATVSRANYRLADMGIIKLYQKGVGLDAHTFCLPPDLRSGAQVEHTEGRDRTFPFMSKCSVGAPDAFSSVWEHRGLGRTARIIWDSLVNVQKDYQAISETSGRGLRTVKKWVPKLIRQGLVIKVEQGYQQATKIDWASNARHLLTQNIHAERIIKHRKDRETFVRLMCWEG